eukprot:3056218-Pyramimonas_sp.AAC.1
MGGYSKVRWALHVSGNERASSAAWLKAAGRPDRTTPQREVYYLPSIPKCCLRWLAPYCWDYRYYGTTERELGFA